MVKLNNYQQCIEIRRLLFKMGALEIKNLPETKFEHKVIKIHYTEVSNIAKINLYKKLKTEQIQINHHIKNITLNEIIQTHGIKCCIYIKNQHKFNDFKYHLCLCSTIKDMEKEGRVHRFVATSRDDGLFPVSTNGNKELRRLSLCKNCIKILKEKKMYFSPFSLEEFYKKYQPDIPKTLKREERIPVMEEYSPNQQEIAQRYKKLAEYKCQLCGVDCSSHRKCLHLHHKNGEKQDNRYSNLQILCACCHSEQFKHGHMKNNPENIPLYAIIKQLRIEQGLTLSSA